MNSRRPCAQALCFETGGDRITLTLDERLAPAKRRELDILALDSALQELSRLNAQQGRIIEMRLFGGLSIEDTAQALGISPATVRRDRAVARAWLYREMVRSTQR